MLRAFDRPDDEVERLMRAGGDFFVGNKPVDMLTADSIEARAKLGSQSEAALHELVVLGLLDEVNAMAAGFRALDPVDFDSTPAYRRRVDGSVPAWYRTVLGTDVVDRMRLS